VILTTYPRSMQQ